MALSTIGIDISKAHLDAYRLSDGARRRFPNDRTGLRALRKWLEEQPPERIVYEPTGPYHRLLEHTLLRAGLPLIKVIRDRRGGSPRRPVSSQRRIALMPPSWHGWALSSISRSGLCRTKALRISRSFSSRVRLS